MANARGHLPVGLMSVRYWEIRNLCGTSCLGAEPLPSGTRE
jgi:hypothetical protein